MSRAAVATFALRHNVPRINRHHEVYYSRQHIDAIKDKQTKLNPDYYSYKEISEKYGLTPINISYYVNQYAIDRFKQGSRTFCTPLRVRPIHKTIRPTARSIEQQGGQSLFFTF